MNRDFLAPILLLASFLLAVYFVLPKYSQYQDLKTELAEKKIKLTEKQSYLDQLNAFSEQLDEHKQSLEKIDSALPDQMSFASLLGFFQEAAMANGLVLQSLNQADNPLSQEEQENRLGQSAVREIYVSLNLEGRASAFDNFLLSIEKSARMIEVEDISVKQSTQGGKGLLGFYLLIKVYSY